MGARVDLADKETLHEALAGAKPRNLAASEPAMDPAHRAEQRILKIEEHKEVGHEYRYRDQLMVQQFSLSMLAVAAVLNVLRGLDLTTGSWLIQALVALFLGLLWRHMRNVNADRRAALERKEELRVELGFAAVHGGAAGHRRSLPRELVRFSGLIALIWTAWTVASLVEYLAEIL